LDLSLLVLAQGLPHVWAQVKQDKRLRAQPVKEPRITVCTKPFNNTNTASIGRSNNHDEYG
jgi:hypothetical protein